MLRKGVYYNRAAVPLDIRDTYPKTEEVFSLKTKDPREAVKLVRKAAAEVDARFDEHRRRQNAVVTTRDELTDAELKAVEQAYYVYLLEANDQRRDTGFYDSEMLDLPAPTFDEYAQDAGDLLKTVQHQLPRRKSDPEPDPACLLSGIGSKCRYFVRQLILRRIRGRSTTLRMRLLQH